jgi:hypothetical protein
MRLDYNGPYVDECDYMFVGRQLLAHQGWNTQTYIFSSNLPLYLLGFADQLGGLLAARGMCAAMGLLSLAFYHRFIAELSRNRAVAIVATLFVALSASHAFISKFATYDMLCCLAFVAGLWALGRALRARGWAAHAWTALSSALFATAILSKYVVILQTPVLALLVLVKRPRLMVAFGVPALAMCLSYAWVKRDALAVLYATQLSNTHEANATRLRIALIVARYLAPLLVLFVAAAAVQLARTKKSVRALPWFGWSAALAVPMIAYHFKAADRISMYKHLVYAVMFLAPWAAVLIVRVVRSRRLWVLAPAAVSVVCAHGLFELGRMEQAFPDLRRTLAQLPADTMGSFTLLSEDPYFFRYALMAKTTNDRLYEDTWFDNDKDGKRTSKDVIDAVYDGKFQYIFLDGRVTPRLTKSLRGWALRRNYELVYQQPYVVSDVMSDVTGGVLELYRRRGPYKGKWPLVR